MAVNNTENYVYDEGAVPAAHRFSYADSPSRPSSQSNIADSMTSRPLSQGRMDSDPFTTPPITTGSLGAGGAGASYMPIRNQQPEMRQTSAAYQNVPSEQYWPESKEPHRDYYAEADAKARRNRRWKIIAAVVTVLAIGGIVGGVVASRLNANKSSKQGDKDNETSSGNNNSGSSGNSIANGPADFQKDSRLHQSFWGIAYTPQGAILPNCDISLANVTQDIQLLSQLTTRLRLYGANCNATAMVLQAVQDTKVDLTIWPAIYIDSNTQAYTTQVTAITDALKSYGTDHIEGIIVGNEYILNTATTASNTSSVYTSAVQTIINRIDQVNSTIQGMNLDKHLPIGTSDAGSLMSTTLAAGIDFFMANVHPWFGSVPIDQAAAWTTDFFNDWDVAVAQTAPNKPNCYIAETGWPSESMDRADENNGATGAQGDASLANLQTFLDTWVCSANKNGTEYFFFEAFDEPWKSIYGGVEPYWGLFDKNRNLKNVTIPVCS